MGKCVKLALLGKRDVIVWRLHSILTPLAVVALALLLAACETGPRPVPASEPPAAVPEPKPTREEHIQTLLYRADMALSRGRLLLPAYDNAYDRYAAVLLMDVDNREARAGLQAIVLRYLDMARDAAQRSRFAEAETYLRRAGQVLPDNANVQALVETERQQMAARPEALATSGSFPLDVVALRAESEAALEALAGIARQAREEDRMVLIVAETDAQGRWIYQQMREQVPGYLLRGDIRVGAPVRIEFIDE